MKACGGETINGISAKILLGDYSPRGGAPAARAPRERLPPPNAPGKPSTRMELSMVSPARFHRADRFAPNKKFVAQI